MKRAGVFQFVLGIVVGAVFFGGTAAIAAGIMAQPKTAAIVIDGQTVDLKGYLVEGNHYFQLRDLSDKLAAGDKDFSIVWDGQGNRVLIDTGRGYDPNEQYTPESTTPPEQEMPAMSIDEMKVEIVRLTNEERTKAGLPALEVLPALMDTAQRKAQDFIDNHYFGHISPVYGTPGEMIKAAIPHIKSAGENIGTWANTPEAAFAGWLNSQEHLDVMLAQKYTHIGVGIIQTADGGFCWVQQFAAI